MNILFISSRRIWPATGGREFTISNRIHLLREMGHCVDVFYCGLETDKTGNADSEFIGVKLSVKEKVWNLFRFLFSMTVPFQFSLYYSKKNLLMLLDVLKNKDYDFIVVDMIRLAPLISYLKKNSVKGKMILDLDDLISERYKRIKNNVMGQASKSNRFLSKLFDFKIFRSVALGIERTRLKKAEKMYPALFDASILVNNIETEKLKDMIPKSKNKIFSLPVFVLNQHLKSNDYSIETNRKCIKLGFAGLLTTPANYASLSFIVKEILPKLTIDYSFEVIGKVDDSIKNEFKNFPVSFTGYVDDFRNALSHLDLFVCPIAFGTGIKTKIIEAMSCGVPVLTNETGAEGLEIENGRNILISNNAEDLAASIIKCFDDRKILFNIGREGYRYVFMNHSQDLFLKKIKEVYVFLME